MTNNPTKRKIQRAHTPEEKSLIQTQYTARKALTAIMQDTVGRAQVVLVSVSGANNPIPLRQLPSVRNRIGDIVQSMFTRNGQAFAENGVTAVSPLARVINQGVAQATFGAVKTQHDWMRKHVPADVFRWLAGNTLLREQFAPNPLAQYDPAHTWVDPNGYTLSDRIWQNGVRTRLKVDQLLTEGIRQGRPAVEIAAQLERFLRPDRAAFRTHKPYGSDGSFDALRLVRTEITAAHGRAYIAAARANPYVETINWNLSPSHPRTDVCDDLADRSPYALTDVPQYPAHPHCLCYLTSNMRPVDEVTAELREMMARGEPPPYTTPANLYGFLVELLGAALVGLIADLIFG
jgi:hypothetical protein